MNGNESNELLSAYNTRPSLLLRLKESGDDASWREFYGIYGRLIFGYALRFRMSHSEAEDVVQDVSVKLFRQILAFDYSPDQGHFRGWLKTVTRHAVIDYIRRKERRTGRLENYRQYAEVLNEEKQAEDDALWRSEWKQALVDAALLRVYARIGDTGRRTFHLFAVEGLSAKEVGEKLDMDPNAVYACKHRVLGMIREEVENLRDEL